MMQNTAVSKSCGKHLLLMIGIWFAAITPIRANIIIDGYNAAANDRFQNDGAFIAAAYDLSGVAITDTGHWLTMVSPNVYVTANHFHAGTGASVTFYASNDPLGGTTTRVISASAERIGNSDLWIGTLDAPLTAQHAYYSFATQSLSTQADFNSSAYHNANAFVFGRSPGSYPVSQDMAIGFNKLDLWFAAGDTTDNNVTAIGATVDSSGDANYLAYEAYLQGGDSGAPLFVKGANGELTLTGINWFINPNDSDIDFDGFSYVGNYGEEIQSFVNAHAVAEPSALALFASAAGLFFCGSRLRRRRKK